jgi:hypothetical protein
VPSITELVCELGLAEQLVGRTGFCIHPKEALKKIPKVGGTKSVNLRKLRELAPTHVIVNIDENKKERIRWRLSTILRSIARLGMPLKFRRRPRRFAGDSRSNTARSGTGHSSPERCFT